MSSIPENLAAVRHIIQECESRYSRTSGSVTLLAASKAQSAEKILAAFQAGQTCFGENYLQEALAKMEILAAEKIEWHFIGPIQSNKTKKIAEHFHWVQSVDDFKQAKRLNEQRPSSLAPLNICLQVNISQEPSKSGVHPDDALSLAKECLSLSRLKLRGLMAIPAPQKNLADQRQEFGKMAALQKSFHENGLKIDTLSMGMSDDMEAAIAEGATMVRIGTRIFGER
jgi:PLP dependent protein